MPGAKIRVVLQALRATRQALELAGIWYCLTYGSLLGALRDGRLIGWDTDFDLFIRPTDVPAILRLSGEELCFEVVRRPGADLAVGSGAIPWFDPGRLAVLWEGQKLGDLFLPTLFDDGVCRMYDLEREVVWMPHRSFPHYFVEHLSLVELEGERYPAPAEGEKFLEGVYGPDWRTPYRAVQHGGIMRAGSTIQGDVYLPKLAEELSWCRARGWDTERYGNEPSWPRDVRGGGPVGPTAETAVTSRALWWQDLEMLKTHF